MISFGSDIAALKAERRLRNATTRLTGTSERLSSGLRIVHAKDDAAGLSIAAQLHAGRRISLQGIRNLNDGIALIDIAEGGLQSLDGIVTRLRELAIQSANGSYSDKQREALDREAQALVDEYNRIIPALKFNGRPVIDGTQSYSIEAGDAGTGSTSIDFLLGSVLAQRIGDGGFADQGARYNTSNGAFSIRLADFNNDGNLDAVLSADSCDVFLGAGDGSFTASTGATPFNSAYQVATGDFNGDGNQDVVSIGSQMQVAIGNGDGTFLAATNLGATYVQPPGSHDMLKTADLNGDGFDDIVNANGTNAVEVRLSNGDGSFQAPVSYGGGPNAQRDAVALADFDGDGTIDIAAMNDGSSTISIYFNNGAGAFTSGGAFSVQTSRQFVAGDVDGDGDADLAVRSSSADISILLNDGSGSFSAGQTITPAGGVYAVELADVDGDTVLDIVYGRGTLRNDGTGTFAQLQTYTGVPGLFALGDINNDGVTDVAQVDSYPTNQWAVFLGTSSLDTSLRNVSIATRSSALSVLARLEALQASISLERGTIGSVASRIHAALGNLQQSTSTMAGVESQIADADVAEESSRLIAASILQRGAAAVLEQAGSLPELGLSLIRSARGPA